MGCTSGGCGGGGGCCGGFDVADVVAAMVFVVMDVPDRVTTEVAAVGEGGDELLFLLGGEVAGGHD